MTSSTDKAEPKKPELTQDDFSQTDQPKESHVLDSNTPEGSPIENGAPLSPQLIQMMVLTWSLKKRS